MIARATQWQHDQREEGRCPSCGGPNLDVNPQTGKSFWQCATCRTIHADRMKEVRRQSGALRGRRDSVPCKCGKPMRPTADACFYCRYQAAGWKRIHDRKPAKSRTFTQPVPRHIPSSIYTQHDPIAASFRWRQAVSR